jgi:hypothetical protein
MGSLILLCHVALCNCVSSDCGNFSNTFPEVVICTRYTGALMFLWGVSTCDIVCCVAVEVRGLNGDC